MATQKELRAEITRLRELVAAIEKQNGCKGARVEFSEDGHMILTAPGMDEQKFGEFVAAQMALLVNAAGVLKLATGVERIIP